MRFSFKSSLCSVCLLLKTTDSILCYSGVMSIIVLHSLGSNADTLEWSCTCLPVFCLILLSISHGIFMLTAKVTSGNARWAPKLFGHFLSVCKDHLLRTSLVFQDLLAPQNSFGEAFHLLLQVGAVHSSSTYCLHVSSGVTRSAAPAAGSDQGGQQGSARIRP